MNVIPPYFTVGRDENNQIVICRFQYGENVLSFNMTDKDATQLIQLLKALLNNDKSN